MRNLKKVLTLVLTLAMLLSVMVVGAGAATFGDQESITNKEAVDMCVALNIIGGYEDGTFRPTGNVTRAEMCKMICVALNGGKEPTMGSGLIGTFNDVSKDDWSAPYIEYCVSQGIVGGVGGGRFNPTGNITGTQAAKMLLCILGYNASIQGYVGSDYWETNINVDAAQKGLYEDLVNIDASVPLTRDQAAQMIWNALNAYEVEYVTILVTNPDGSMSSKVVVQDKVVQATNDKISLLADKYEVTESIGYLNNYKWNEAKERYEYDVLLGYDKDGNAVNVGNLPSKTDFGDLYGMKVKAIWNTDKRSGEPVLFSIVPWGSSVVATGVLGDVEYSDVYTVKIDGTSYGTDEKAEKLKSYAVNQYNASEALFNSKHELATDMYKNRHEWTFSAIDNDGDGKIDLLVVHPFTVAKVDYVGPSNFNRLANEVMGVSAKSVSFDEVVAYEGMARNDFVKIVSAVNSPYQKDTYTKIDSSVEGLVTSTKVDAMMIDNNWYNCDDTFVKYDLKSAYRLVMVNDYVCAIERVKNTEVINDYAVVLSTSTSTPDPLYGNRAKLLFADGKSEIVTTDKDYSDPAGDGTSAGNDSDNLVNKLVKFSIKDGDYVLEAAQAYNSNADANSANAKTAGFDTILNPATGHDKGGSNYTGYQYASNGKSELGGEWISGNAVIFAQSSSGSWKVISGTALQRYADTSVDQSFNIYANKAADDGFYYVDLACIKLTGAVTEITRNYGYVVGVGEQMNGAHGGKVSVLTVWNGEADVKMVADSDLSKTVKVGSVITYKDNGDETYSIKLKEDLTLSAVKGYNTGDRYVGLKGTSYKVTDETVILNIDSADKVGVSSKSLQISNPNNTPNVYWYSTDGKELDVIIFDVDNVMQIMPGVITSQPSPGGIQGALESSTDVTLDLTNITTGTESAIVPEGSNVKVTEVDSGVTAINLTAKENSNVNIDSANSDKVHVVTEPGSTVTISGNSDKIPTITGSGNVIINKSGLTGGTFNTDGGFGPIEVVNAAKNTGGANAVTVARGLELSGTGMLDVFDNMHTLTALAERTGSTTVTPVKLDLANIGKYIDAANGAEVKGTLTLKNGQTMACIFKDGDKLNIAANAIDYPTAGTLSDDAGVYMYMTIGDQVSKATLTVTNKATSPAADKKTQSWTFNFVD